MSTAAAAQDLARQGFHVFPLAVGGGTPAHKGWQEEATNDPERVAQLWGTRAYNVGIFTGRGPGGALLVVDVDRKAGRDGFRSIMALELDGKDLPPTREHATKSGGRHLIYSTPAPVKQGTNVLGQAVDVRSRGGYIVAPGSVFDSGAYTVANALPIAPAPAWLVDACGFAPSAHGQGRAKLPGIDPERAQARAIDWLRAQPPAAQGERNDAGFRVAAKLKDLGVDADQCASLMLEHWSCEPMLGLDEVQHVVRSAFAYGRSAQGSDAPEALFEAIEPDKANPGAPHPFDLLNQEWAAVAEPPNTVVYRTRTDAGTGQTVFERYTREGFLGLLANQKMDGAPLAQKWWESTKRRTYEGGTDFAPSGRLPGNVLNTWGGFAVAPAPGDWSLMREHIRSVICGGDAALDRYVVGWLARAVQRPGEPGQVALVLRGGRGTGKGTLGEMLCRIFGRHGMHIGNTQRLTGTFNGHLDGKVLLFADEAFYAGDKKHEGTLKALITERSLDLEAKYAAARNVRNCLHILMASNDDWVVPSGPIERRFCVIDVSDQRQQDNAYFGRIRAQMETGGLAAMLHDLQAYDLQGFDVFAYPRTHAATEQQTSSLRGPHAWLFDALARGRIAGEDWEDRELQIAKGRVFDDYRTHARDAREYKPVDRAVFWRQVGQVLAKGGLMAKDTRPTVGMDREVQRIFPPLSETRRAFELFLGGAPISWDGG